MRRGILLVKSKSVYIKGAGQFRGEPERIATFRGSTGAYDASAF